MTYYAEVRPGLKRSGAPKLVPLEDVPKYRGFRSVFSFPPDVAELIRAQRGTYGLRGVEVHADTIFLDFDNVPADATIERLRNEGIGFAVLDSGHRSTHLHIDLVPVTGCWVPAAYKAWAKEYAPTSDMSFMSPSGMYRLEGSYHAKRPGNRKQLIERYEGVAVVLKPANNTVLVSHRFHADEGDAYHKFFAGLTQTQAEGNRRPYIFRNALLGAEAGLSEAEVLDHMCWWASHFCIPPHEPRAVAEQVSNAFKYLLRKVGNGE